MTAAKGDRFLTRYGEAGWAVYDNWTGLAVVIAGVTQSAMTPGDADELALLLQSRTNKGDRRIYD